MDRKALAVSILSIGLIVSSITNVVLIFNYPQETNLEDLSTLVVGTSHGLYTLELVDAWDSGSNDVLEQVVETLFFQDLRDPALPRINLLAESYYWYNKTSVQIKLREDILFHDGTPFNSIAAKWNLDRLLYLTNCTGDNIGLIAQTQSLWMHPDGKTPIINSVEVVDEYNITITLNAPYGPFLNLLTYINAGMISPTAHSDKFNEFIRLDEKIIGTGPFKFEHYNPGVEVVLSRWKSYRENLAYFDVLKFKIYNRYYDVDKVHEALLDGTIDINFLASYEDVLAYEDEEDITVKHYTEDTGIPSLMYQYISFNSEKFNQTWRRAMSYAVNYTYIIDELLQGKGERANSPISPGYGAFYNESAKAPSFNITKAREIMVSMGFGDMGWSDQQWMENDFKTVRYTYYVGSSFREKVGVSLVASFRLIGIDLWLDEWNPWDPWYPNPYLYEVDYEIFDLYASGWGPDYLEPYNMLDPLFSPISSSNIALVNDTKLNTMMNLALETTDDTARNIIYKDIQGYLTKACFHAPLYHAKIISVHSANLRNVPYNAMQSFQAYGIWRI